MKYSNCSLVPSLLVKDSIRSYFVENSQKAMINVLFKLRLSVKPSKFSVYFVHDCRCLWLDVYVCLTYIDEIFFIWMHCEEKVSNFLKVLMSFIFELSLPMSPIKKILCFLLQK